MFKESNFNICAVTVWFNPSDECVKNVGLYNEHVNKVYIIDNSSVSNLEKVNQYSNVVYVANYDNMGIARALNQGCLQAFEDGFEFCMTMDQDSQWEELQLITYLKLIKENQTDKNVSFSPCCYSPIKRESVLWSIKNFLKEYKRNEKPLIVFDDFSIVTSGNVVNLAVWKIIGGFYEPFFIDMVDFDFNCRLIENGFRILKFNQVKLVHSIGNNHRSFLPYESHSPVRVYYMTRNIKYAAQMHKNFLKSKNYTVNSLKLLRNILINFHIKKLLYYIRGIKDFKKRIFGKLISDQATDIK